MAITYEPLTTTTLTSATAEVVFGSIPNTYTDLVLIVNGGFTQVNQSFYFRFNSDSSSIYSYTYMAGSGSATSSNKSSGPGIAAYNVNGQSDTLLKSQATLQLQNYSNTTTFKTCLIRGNTDLTTQTTVGLYRSTSAINALTILATNGNLQTGSTFTLYGILKA